MAHGRVDSGVVVGSLLGPMGVSLSLPSTGPLFAFAIANADLEVLRLGSFFWALAGGLLVSPFLERNGWKTRRHQAAE